MVRKIVVINEKGGSGKTTTAVNLGVTLGELRKKVLLVDMDSQGHATVSLGVDKKDLNHSVWDVITGDVPYREVVYQCHGIDLLPATRALEDLNDPHSLKDTLDRVRGYDFVLIDCPPSLGVWTMAALIASREVLIPIQVEYLPLEGITALLDTIQAVRETENRSLKILGVLPVMYDSRTRLSRDVLDILKDYLGGQVLNTIIRRNIRLAEAPSFGLPITKYAPRSNGATDYRRLAKEIITRSP